MTFAPHPRRQLQEAQRVGDGRAVLAEALGERLLRVAVLAHEPLERLGELDGVRSSRWTFSMRASSNASFALTSLTTTSASRSPAFCSARHRRSPAMSSNLSPPPGTRRTTSGSTRPCSRMLCASSSSFCASKCCRGWPFCGTIFSSGQREDALVAVGAARTGPPAGARRARARARAASVGHAHRAARSRAGARRRRLAREQLAREREVPLRALRLHVVEERRLAVRRRLAQAHVARDDRVEDVEVLLHLVGHLVGQVVARVEHRRARSPRPRASAFMPPRTRSIVAMSARQPLERVVLALHRHEHAVGRGQRVDREDAERRRAVDEHVLERLARASSSSSAARSLYGRSGSSTSSTSTATRSCLLGTSISDASSVGCITSRSVARPMSAS